MTTIRKTAKITLTLSALFITVAILIKWTSLQLDQYYFEISVLWSSKDIFSWWHGFIVQFSFWLVLLASCIETLFCEISVVNILKCLRAPLVLVLFVAAWGIVAMFTLENFLLFWMFYYGGLFVCNQVVYRGITSVKGAGPSGIKLFLKSPPSKNGGDVSLVDRYVLYVTRIALLVNMLVLPISLAVYFVQYQQMFGF